GGGGGGRGTWVEGFGVGDGGATTNHKKTKTAKNQKRTTHKLNLKQHIILKNNNNGKFKKTRREQDN
ncbi:hypothetical protein ACQWG0_25565, partial [Salmonella enterica subsp. enterica serovar Infantis]